MPYEHILAAARNRDKLALQQALSLGPIDEFKVGSSEHSAAAQLALEGDMEGAFFLKRFGANVNWIAYGAALGGRTDVAEGLYRAVTAACAETSDQYRMIVNALAKGAAQGGDRDYAETLRTRGAHVNEIAKGAALGGRRDYAEDLHTQHRGYAHIHHIAQSAALGGHPDYAEALRIRIQPMYVYYIAEGAAQGGDRDYAEALRTQHEASVHVIAQGAARGGNREYAEELRIQQGARVDDIARGAAQGGHRDYAETLYIDHGAKIKSISKGAAEGGHFNSIQAAESYLSHIENNQFRNELVTALYEQNTFPNIPQSVRKALPAINKRSNNIQEIHKCFNITLSQARQWHLAFHNSEVSLCIVVLQLMPALAKGDKIRPGLSLDLLYYIGKFIWGVHETQVARLMSVVFKGNLHYSLNRKTESMLFRIGCFFSDKIAADYQQAVTLSEQITSAEHLGELQDSVRNYLPINIDNEEDGINIKEPMEMEILLNDNNENGFQVEANATNNIRSCIFFSSQPPVSEIAEKNFNRMSYF